MKIAVRVVVDTGDATEPADMEVLAIDREDLALDTVGLHLAEARELLGAVQTGRTRRDLAHALNVCLEEASARRCPDRFSRR